MLKGQNRLRACLQGERMTLASRLPEQAGYPSSQAARVTRVGGLPYLRARVTLAGGLTFSLLNTPGRVNPPTQVNFLIVSRPFECNRALKELRHGLRIFKLSLNFSKSLFVIRVNLLHP